jgi:hypothetical protein
MHSDAKAVVSCGQQEATDRIHVNRNSRGSRNARARSDLTDDLAEDGDRVRQLAIG